MHGGQTDRPFVSDDRTAGASGPGPALNPSQAAGEATEAGLTKAARELYVGAKRAMRLIDQSQPRAAFDVLKAATARAEE